MGYVKKTLGATEKTCEYCKASIPSSAEECPKCKANLSPAMMCPHCKYMVPSNSVECPNCFKPLAASGIPTWVWIAIAAIGLIIFAPSISKLFKGQQ